MCFQPALPALSWFLRVALMPPPCPRYRHRPVGTLCFRVHKKKSPGSKIRNVVFRIATRALQHQTIFKIFDAGGDLLSHTLPGAVPSAQTGLASGVGKGPGVTPSQKPPTNISGNTHPHHPTTKEGWLVCRVIPDTAQQTRLSTKYFCNTRTPHRA